MISVGPSWSLLGPQLASFLFPSTSAPPSFIHPLIHCLLHTPPPLTSNMSTRKRKQDAEEEEELQALPSEGSEEEEEE